MDTMYKVDELLEKLKDLGAWVVAHNDGMAVYRRSDTKDPDFPEGRIFLVVHEGSDPLIIDVGVGRDLSKLLKDRYESVNPSRALDARSWIEVICSGQLSDDEVIDLIRASWERAA